MNGIESVALLTHTSGVYGTTLADATAVLTAQKTSLFDRLHRQGYVLLRGFPVRTAADFRALADAIDPRLARYMGQTDRTEIQDRVYESTPVPGAFPIPLHSESAYSAYYPLRGFFFCEKPADGGGESWLADTRKVLAGLPPEIVAKFESVGVRYVRNAPPAGAWVHRLSRLTRSGIVKSWPETFGETDRTRVSEFGRKHGIPMAWKGDWLSLDAVLPAIRVHPITGEKVWFNQAHLYRLRSESNPILGRIVSLLFNRLPAHPVMDSRYGNDEPIPASDIDAIRASFQQNRIAFPLKLGDVLFFDNLLVAHGRAPFQGKRRLLASFSEYAAGEAREVAR